MRVSRTLSVSIADTKQGSSMDQGGGKRRAGVARFFYAVRKCSQWGHYFRVLLLPGWGRHTMRIFGYLGFLIAWLLAPAPMAITVADTVVQAVAPDGTQSHLAEEEEDLLNIWD
jgi:hypothetical protein